jgi:hypothetical protein
MSFEGFNFKICKKSNFYHHISLKSGTHLHGFTVQEGCETQNLTLILVIKNLEKGGKGDNFFTTC